MNRPPSILPVISGLLPLFYEKASSLAMVKHGMEMQRQATAHLNPGQIPVTPFDQPLFAIAKICSMDLALGSWREQACSDVWQIAHGNGIMECMQ